jgi:hypothetical protein
VEARARAADTSSGVLCTSQPAIRTGSDLCIVYPAVMDTQHGAYNAVFSLCLGNKDQSRDIKATSHPGVAFIFHLFYYRLNFLYRLVNCSVVAPANQEIFNIVCVQAASRSQYHQIQRQSSPPSTVDLKHGVGQRSRGAWGRCL